MNEQINNRENIRYNLSWIISNRLTNISPIEIVIESSQHPEHLANWRDEFLLKFDKSYEGSSANKDQLRSLLARFEQKHIHIRPILSLKLEFPILGTESREKTGIYRYYSQAEQRILADLLISLFQGPSLFTSWKSVNSISLHNSSVEEL